MRGARRDEVRLLFVLWLQVPFTDGARLASQHVLTPLLRAAGVVPKRAAVKPAPASGGGSFSQRFLLSAMTHARLVSPRQSEQLEEMATGNNLPLIGSLFFFFTPGFLTAYGCLFVGLGHPLLRSLSATAAAMPPNASARLQELVGVVPARADDARLALVLGHGDGDL